MPITAAGVGSGIDIEGIVSQLMGLERQPLYRLQQKEAQTQTQISDYGALKGAVSSFKDAMDSLGSEQKFKIFTASSSDNGILTASADSSSAGGIYSVVVDRLAQHHKQGSGPVASGTDFGGSAGDELVLTVNGNPSHIDLSTAKDMAGVRDAINQAGDNPGVTATIVNVGNGDQHLVLTADESGYDQRIELSYGGNINAATFGFGTLNKDETGGTMSDLSKLDASLSIDGIAVTAAGNQVDGAVDGLSLKLEGVGSSTLTVERDTGAIKKSAQDFISAYNAVLKKVDQLKEGSLGNDSSLRGIVSQLRSVLNSPATGLSGSYSTLSELGILSNGKTGELELDSTTFTNALDNDFDAVASVFADPGSGYATRFINLSDELLDTNGVLESRVESLNSRVKNYDTRQASLEANLALKEKALRARYSAMDSLVGSLNTTAAFLTSSLNALKQ